MALCVAVVVGTQTTAAIMDQASQKGLELGMERLGADLVAVPRGVAPEVAHSIITGQAVLVYMDAGVEEKIKNLDFVAETSPQVFLKSLSGASCCSAWNVFLIGFAPETDFTTRPWLEKHRDRKIEKNEVLVGKAIQLETGSTIKFFGTKYKVAGVLQATGSGLDTTVFIPMEGLYQMAADSSKKAEETISLGPNQISSVTIKLRPEKDGGLPFWKAAYEIEMAIPEISVIQPNDLITRVETNLSGVLGTMRSASFIIWPVTMILIGLIFAMAVNERRREMGIVRAMGASRQYLFGMIILESVLVTGTGAVLGLVVSFGLMAAFAKLIAFSLEVPFYWPGMNEMTMLAVFAAGQALFIGMAAAFIPALQTSLMGPYEAIRRGE